MAELDFDFEWTDPLGARGEELRATWARLRVLVGGEPVTRVLDECARTVRESVYVPLYPLAEWLATHWWVLCHELETPERAGRPDYRSRHCLTSAREGYSFPPLRFQSLGDIVRLEWAHEKLAHHRLEFVSQGDAHLPLADFQRSVSDFLGAVVARLGECGVESTLLHEEWQAILDSSAPEEDYCRSAAALGLDPYDIDERSRELIVELGDQVPEAVRHEFFAASGLAELGEHARQLAAALEASRTHDVDLAAVRALRRHRLRLPSSHQPWDEGHAVARCLRQRLEVGTRALSTFGDLAEVLRIEEALLHRALLEPAAARPFFDAVVEINAAGNPGFVLGSRRQDARLFHFCRGLFEFLTAVNGAPCLLTRTGSDRQKRNRAFAAEFLAPSNALREMLETRSVSVEDVDDLAIHFGVSPYVILHQLENHQIATLPSD